MAGGSMAGTSLAATSGVWSGDDVVNLVIVPNEGLETNGSDRALLTVCINGYGKRTSVSEYRGQGRGGKGLIDIKTTDRNGAVIGMALVGLADIIGVRELFAIAALLILTPGILALFLPGLGQPAAQWKQVIQLLRTAPTAPILSAGRAATAQDVNALARRFTALDALSDADRHLLVTTARVHDAPAGTTIVRFGDKSDAAYIVMRGQAVAGVDEGGETRWLETMGPGDFFGEIAALSGQPRTANVIAREPTTLFAIPARTLRRLMEYPAVSQPVRLKFYERLTRTNLNDLPRFAGMDQATLRELRTRQAPT